MSKKMKQMVSLVTTISLCGPSIPTIFANTTNPAMENQIQEEEKLVLPSIPVETTTGPQLEVKPSTPTDEPQLAEPIEDVQMGTQGEMLALEQDIPGVTNGFLEFNYTEDAYDLMEGLEAYMETLGITPQTLVRLKIVGDGELTWQDMAYIRQDLPSVTALDVSGAKFYNNTLGWEFFTGSSLTDVYLPLSGVDVIEEFAFKEGLNVHNFPSGVKHIDANAFINTTFYGDIDDSTWDESTGDIFAHKTVSDRNSVLIGDYYSNNTRAWLNLKVEGTVHFNSTQLDSVLTLSAYVHANQIDINTPESLAALGVYRLNSKTSVNVNCDLLETSVFTELITQTINFNGNVSDRLADNIFSRARIETLTIPANVTTIPNKMCYVSNIKTLTFLGDITQVGESAFTQADIGDLNWPNTVEHIGASAFERAGIEAMTFGDNLQSVGQAAFKECRITTLQGGLPSTIEGIYDEAFAKSEINFDINNTTTHLALDVLYTSAFTDSQVTGEIIETAELPFRVVRDSVTNTTKVNFQLVDDIKLVTVTYDGTTDLNTLIETTLTSEGLSRGVISGITLIAPNGLKAEDYQVLGAFRHLDLTDVAITSIPNNAFLNDDRLEIVVLPANLLTIGENAFKGCVSLFSSSLTESVFTIPETVTSLGVSSFEGTSALRSIAFNDVITSIPTRCFYASGITRADLGSATTQVQDQAFYSCENLKEITLNEGLLSLGKESFAYCHKLDWVLTLPSTLTTIQDKAFYNCYLLTGTLDGANYQLGGDVFFNTGVKATVKEIVEITVDYTSADGTLLDAINREDATHQATNIKIISTDDTRVKEDDFSYLKGYQKIDLSDILLENDAIPADAFYGDINLQEITFPKVLKSIGARAFKGVPLQGTLTLEHDKLFVDTQAFQDCMYLTELSLKGSHIVLGDYAFYNCKSMVGTVYTAQLENIGIDCFTNTKVVCMPQATSDEFVIEYSYKYGNLKSNYRQALAIYGATSSYQTLKVVCPNDTYLTREDYIALMEIVENSSFKILDLSEAQLGSNSQYIDPFDIRGMGYLSMSTAMSYGYSLTTIKHHTPITVNLDKLILPKEASEVVAHAFDSELNIIYNVEQTELPATSAIYACAFRNNYFGKMTFDYYSSLSTLGEYAITTPFGATKRNMIYLTGSTYPVKSTLVFRNCDIVAPYGSLDINSTVNSSDNLELNGITITGDTTLNISSNAQSTLYLDGLTVNGNLTLNLTNTTLNPIYCTLTNLKVTGNLTIKTTYGNALALPGARIGGDFTIDKVTSITDMKNTTIGGKLVIGTPVTITDNSLTGLSCGVKSTLRVNGNENGEITSNALKGAKNVHFELQEDITTLKSRALAYLNETCTYSLPQSLVTMENSVFQGYPYEVLDLRGCPNLTTIGSNLLQDATQIKEVYFPTQAYTLGTMAIYQAADVSTLKVDLGGITSLAGPLLAETTPNNPLHLPNIPKSLTTASTSSFKNVIFDDPTYPVNQLEVIGADAFRNTNISGTIILDNNVRYIGSTPFANTKISKVVVDAVDWCNNPSRYGSSSYIFTRELNLKELVINPAITIIPKYLVTNDSSDLKLTLTSRLSSVEPGGLSLPNISFDTIKTTSDVTTLAGIEILSATVEPENRILNILKDTNGPQVKEIIVDEIHLENTKNIYSSLLYLLRYIGTGIENSAYLPKAQVYMTLAQGNYQDNSQLEPKFDNKYIYVDGIGNQVDLVVGTNDTMATAWTNLPSGVDLKQTLISVKSERPLTAADIKFLTNQRIVNLDFSESTFENNTIPASSFNNTITNSIGKMSLIFPDTITTIGAYAFQGSAFEMLVIGDNVTTVGNFAFNKTKVTTTFSLGGSAITSVGAQAFKSCNILPMAQATPLDISNLTTLGGANAFTETSLKLCGELDMSTGFNATYMMSLFKGSQNAGDLTIDISTPVAFTIPNEMFANSNVNVRMSDTCLYKVGYASFLDNKGELKDLTHLHIDTMGHSAFKNSTLSVEVTTHDMGGVSLFQGTNLTKVTITDTYDSDSIGPYALADTPMLTEVIQVTNFTGIYTYTINEGAFKNSGIQKFTCTPTDNQSTIINDYAFDNSKLATLQLGQVTTIGDYAFRDCKGLTDLSGFGNTTSIQRIGTAGFANSGLSGITLYGSETLIVGKDAFLGTDTVIEKHKALGTTLHIKADYYSNDWLPLTPEDKLIFGSGNFDTIEILSANNEADSSIKGTMLTDIASLSSSESVSVIDKRMYGTLDYTFDKDSKIDSVTLPTQEDPNFGVKMVFGGEKNVTYIGLDTLPTHKSAFTFNIYTPEQLELYTQMVGLSVTREVNINNDCPNLDLSALVNAIPVPEVSVQISLKSTVPCTINASVEKADIEISNTKNIKGTIVSKTTVGAEINNSLTESNMDQYGELGNLTLKLVGNIPYTYGYFYRGCNVDFTEATVPTTNYSLMPNAFWGSTVRGVNNIIGLDTNLKGGKYPKEMVFSHAIIEDDLTLNLDNIWFNYVNYTGDYITVKGNVSLTSMQGTDVTAYIRGAKTVTIDAPRAMAIRGAVIADRILITAQDDLNCGLAPLAPSVEINALGKLELRGGCAMISDFKLTYNHEKGIVIGGSVFSGGKITQFNDLYNATIESGAFRESALTKLPKMVNTTVGANAFGNTKITGDLVVPSSVTCDGQAFSQIAFNGRLEFNGKATSKLIFEGAKFNNQKLILNQNVPGLSLLKDNFISLQELTIRADNFTLDYKERWPDIYVQTAPNLEIITFDGLNLNGKLLGLPRLHTLKFTNPLGKYVGTKLFGTALDLVPNTHEYQHIAKTSIFTTPLEGLAFPMPLNENKTIVLSPGTTSITTDDLTTKYGRTITSAYGLTQPLVANKTSKHFSFKIFKNGKEVHTALQYLPEGDYDLELYWNVTFEDPTYTGGAAYTSDFYTQPIKLPITKLVIGAEDACSVDIDVKGPGVVVGSHKRVVKKGSTITVDYYGTQGGVPNGYSINGSYTALDNTSKTVNITVNDDSKVIFYFGDYIMGMSYNVLFGNSYTEILGDELKPELLYVVTDINGNQIQDESYYYDSYKRIYYINGEARDTITNLDTITSTIEIESEYVASSNALLKGAVINATNIAKRELTPLDTKQTVLGEAVTPVLELEKYFVFDEEYMQNGELPLVINGVNLLEAIPFDYIDYYMYQIESLTDSEGNVYTKEESDAMPSSITRNSNNLRGGVYTARIKLDMFVYPLDGLPVDMDALATVPIIGEERGLYEPTRVLTYADVPVKVIGEQFSIFADGDLYGTVTPDETLVDEGDSVTFTLMPDEGCVPFSVSINYGDPILLNPTQLTYTLDSVTEFTYLRFSFEPIPVSDLEVSIDKSEGGTITPIGVQQVVTGDTITITSVPDIGYELDEILVNDVPVANPTKVFTTDPIYTDTTIKVEFAKTKQDVTVSASEGGQVTPLGTQQVEYGTTITVNATPNVGYTLDKITVNGIDVVNPTTTYTTEPIVETTEIEVSFKKTTTQVTITNSDGGTVTPNGTQDVTYDDTITITTTPDEGYVLDEIVVNHVPVANPTDVFTTEPITEPTTIEVIFSKESNEVTVVSSEGGVVTPLGKQQVDYGKTITVSATPQTGYVLDKIIVNGTAVTTPSENFTTEPITKPTTIEVVFAKTSNEVTISSSEGGLVNPLGKQDVEYGKTITITTTPDESYVLDTIIVNGVEVDSPSDVFTTGPITEPTTIEVVFSKKSNEVTIVSTEGGTVTPSGKHTVDYGKTITLITTPAVGYKLKEITVNGTKVPNVALIYTTEPITSATRIEVIFEKTAHKVDISTSTGGTVTPMGTQQVYYGETLTIQANALTGYALDTIEVNGVLVSNAGLSYTTEPITKDTTIKYNFKLVTEPSKPSNPGGGTTPTEDKPTVPVKERIKITFFIGDKHWYINDQKQDYLMDVAPQLKAGRSYIPIRFLSYALKVDSMYVRWDAKTRTANIKDGENIMTLYEGQELAYLNNKPHLMDASAFVTKGRTMLPISQILDVYAHRKPEVIWDASQKKVDIWLDIIADLNPSNPDTDWYIDYTSAFAKNKAD